VSRKLKTALPALKQPLYEGGYGGRERDPLWPKYFESAWRAVCFKHLGTPGLSLADHARLGLTPPLSLFIEAESIAARGMLRVERGTAQSRMQRRAKAA